MQAYSTDSDISDSTIDMSQWQERQPVLTASVRDVRFVAALLRGINFSNRASITLTADAGMIVTVEEAHCVLATSYIYRDHFDEWNYSSNLPETSQHTQQTPGDESDSITFEIPLTALIDCLAVFGSANLSAHSAAPKPRKWRREGDASDEERGTEHNQQQHIPAQGLERFFSAGNGKRTTMRLSYAGHGYPLTLFLAEDSSGPTTTCEVMTFDPEPGLELPFDGDQTVLKIIFKSSSWLRDALFELDPSCEKITFVSNPVAEVTRTTGRRREHGEIGASKPLFRIRASGDFGSTEMDYPNDREVLETFECSRSVSASYRFAHISHTIRALQISTKTSLRIETEGLLSLQFLVPVPKAKGAGMSDSFIEFRCMALDDEVA